MRSLVPKNNNNSSSSSIYELTLCRLYSFSTSKWYRPLEKRMNWNKFPSMMIASFYLTPSMFSTCDRPKCLGIFFFFFLSFIRSLLSTYFLYFIIYCLLSFHRFHLLHLLILFLFYFIFLLQLFWIGCFIRISF